ncbi:MAG: hypothetical protein Tsb0016_10310 [Sphingomonadales bacterium]
MLDLGSAELVLIGLVALAILGPRELAKLLKAAGQLYGKLKRQWDDLREGIEDIGREDERARIAAMRGEMAQRGRSLGRSPAGGDDDDILADMLEPEPKPALTRGEEKS